MILPAIGFEPPEGGWTSFSISVQQRLNQQGVDAISYPAWRSRMESETEQRERDGEGDHLIHYALLSRSFTTLPPIEPALSAKKFLEQGRIPPAAESRLRAFATALRKQTQSERILELQAIAQGRDLRTEYARAMQFLYAKEFEHKSSYTRRGHSTDTAVTANYAVWQGLNVLSASVKPAIRQVLIIGPGLDLAPRTELIETLRPQSYQPFAVLDALLALHLPTPVIHCLDINPRVIRFFETFAAHPTLELHAQAGNAAYLKYFDQLGSHLGEVQVNSAIRSVNVTPELARAVTAERRNIVTDPPLSGYDLVIATNVLLYYEGPALTVALAHIAQSLRAGGYLLHNDLRPETEAATQAAGFQAVSARTMRISATTFDSFALYSR